jgi:hypothetical protein
VETAALSRRARVETAALSRRVRVETAALLRRAANAPSITICAAVGPGELLLQLVLNRHGRYDLP